MRRRLGELQTEERQRNTHLFTANLQSNEGVAQRFIKDCINNANVSGGGVACGDASRRCSGGESRDTKIVGGQ